MAIAERCESELALGRTITPLITECSKEFCRNESVIRCRKDVTSLVGVGIFGRDQDELGNDGHLGSPWGFSISLASDST